MAPSAQQHHQPREGLASILLHHVKSWPDTTQTTPSGSPARILMCHHLIVPETLRCIERDATCTALKVLLIHPFYMRYSLPLQLAHNPPDTSSSRPQTGGTARHSVLSQDGNGDERAVRRALLYCRTSGDPAHQAGFKKLCRRSVFNRFCSKLDLAGCRTSSHASLIASLMPVFRLKERLLLKVIHGASAVAPDDLDGIVLVVISSPGLPFPEAALVNIQQWVLGGGALLVLAEQGGDASSGEHQIQHDQQKADLPSVSRLVHAKCRQQPERPVETLQHLGQCRPRPPAVSQRDFAPRCGHSRCVNGSQQHARRAAVKPRNISAWGELSIEQKRKPYEM